MLIFLFLSFRLHLLTGTLYRGDLSLLPIFFLTYSVTCISMDSRIFILFSELEIQYYHYLFCCSLLPALTIRNTFLLALGPVDTPHPSLSTSCLAAQDAPDSSDIFSLGWGIGHLFVEPWILFVVIKLIFNRSAKAI